MQMQNSMFNLVPGCIKEYKRNEYIFLTGTRDSQLYFLLSGLAEISYTFEDGQEKILQILEAGKIFGESSFVDKPHYINAKAVSNCRVKVFSIDDLTNLFKTNPDIAMELFKSLSKRLHNINMHILHLSFCNAENGVAFILYSLLSKLGVQENAQRPVVDITQEDIAKIWGTSRVTVSNSLKKLQDKRVIKNLRKKIVITNEAALKSMVDFL